MQRDNDLKTLEYYQERDAKQTFWARVALLSVIFAMLAGNIWLSQRNHQVFLVNLDQSRLEASQLDELREADVAGLHVKLQALEAQLAELKAGQAPPVVVAQH